MNFHHLGTENRSPVEIDGLILLLLMGLGSDPRRESIEDISMSMILFPLAKPCATEPPSVARHVKRRQATPSSVQLASRIAMPSVTPMSGRVPAAHPGVGLRKNGRRNSDHA